MKLERKYSYGLPLFKLISILSLACTPTGDKIEPVRRPAATATSTATPSNSAIPTGTPSSLQTASGCKEGSEPAVAELRTCCRERNWGKACDGPCWAAGVGEKLRRMCNATKTPVSDCNSSPAKTQLNEWCNFHYNRRYCGITDAEWTQTCKSASGK